MKLILRILINAVAIWAAAYLIDDIQLSDSVQNILLVAIIFGLVNALIRPIVKLFSLPITVLTLGLFTFVINALMLMLTGWLSGGALETGGFVAALMGSVVISIVSTVLSWFLPD
ncbi:MAG: phage holin family protein [Caldilineaceae bacterium]|nr:phage holin family protein [Caldilineaceae bacterium]